MLSIKRFMKSILYRFTNPYVTYFLLPILTKNNLYVDTLYLNKNLLKTLQNLQGYHRFIVTSTGLLILFYSDTVVKISLGMVSKESLNKNFRNFNLLKKSEFHPLVNYRLTKIHNYYEMQKLQKTVMNNIVLTKILDKFSHTKNQVKLNIFKNNLFINLEKIESICNVPIYFPAEMNIESIVMHGDFTHNNIMKNSQNELVLIDLDRFVFQGIDNIDKLHFTIDNKSIMLGISFFDSLQMEIESCTSKEQFKYLYIYFILRICYEYNDSIQLPIAYYENIKKLIQKFNIHTQGLN